MSILELFDKYGAYSLALQILLPDEVEWLDYATLQDTNDVRYANRLIIAYPFKFRLVHISSQEVKV